MTQDEIMQRLLCMAEEARSPEFQQRLAEREAQRTDPWRWYCRLCGATGESSSRMTTIDEAHAHTADGQPCGRGTHKAEDEAGRLLHVWSY